MECGISVSSGHRLLDPASLVDQAASTHPLPLTFTNNDGRSLDILFQLSSSVLLANSIDEPSASNKASPCHLEGESDGLLSAVNLCHADHISGLIVTPNDNFILDVRNGTFVLLPQSRTSCELGSRVKRQNTQRPVSKYPGYYSKFNDGKWRYVELALVADYSMYAKYKSDEKLVIDRLGSIANIVNSLYYPMKVKVSLVHVEVWKDGDKFAVKESGDKTLDSFLTYRKSIIKTNPHDNAHMLTDIRFEAGVVGKAFKGTMCSYDYSGGVDVDHAENAAVVAATVAHEMGHNFGMEHDVDYTTCECPRSQCIMAPSSGSTPSEFWSDCSLRYLSKGFKRGIDLCLLNEPEKKIGDIKCGNGIVETGEECDCGETCSNNCCDAKTCKLVGDAECGAGDCCDLETCKARPRATECRSPKGICDLPEYCNGETFDCPADFYVQDGAFCPERSGEYCYSGVCGSRTDQCTFIWGPNTKVADDQCFTTNEHGIVQGNCGYDVHSQNFSRCAKEDIMCGRLHCDTTDGGERPIFGDPSTVIQASSAFRTRNNEVKKCHVIKTTYVATPDPGMVPDGSKCGEDKFCVEAKCRSMGDINKTVAVCNDNCHYRGVCNNVGNCHCDNGFGGISCEIPGYGGSVNSNTANLHRGITPSLLLLVFCGIFAVGFVFACIYYKVKRKRNLPAELWQYSRKTLNLHGALEPVRKAPPPPGGRRRNKDTLNSMWGDATVTYSTTERAPPFVPPVIPLMTASPMTSPVHQTYNSKPYVPVPSLSRVPSVRPREPPPIVPVRPRDSAIVKLYAEHGDELGIRPPAPDKPLPPPPPDPYPTKSGASVSRSDSTLRPVVPPPPPPNEMKPTLGKPAPPAKPHLPKKGPVVANEPEEKVNVKKMAAMMDQKKKNSS